MLLWINGPFGGGKTQTGTRSRGACRAALSATPSVSDSRRASPYESWTSVWSRSGAEFAEHIRMDKLTAPQAAGLIAESAAARLIPDTDSALRHRLRCGWIGIKHIRFD